MQLRKMLALTLLCSSLGEAAAINDLSFDQTVELSAEFYLGVSDSDASYYLRVSHAYTNSLICSGTIQVPILRYDRHVIKHQAFSNIKIMPPRAFGEIIEVELPMSLNEGEEFFIVPELQSMKIVCSGDPNDLPLPPEFCQAADRLAGHEEMCAMLSRNYGPGTTYPVIMHGDYIGRCDCP